MQVEFTRIHPWEDICDNTASAVTAGVVLTADAATAVTADAGTTATVTVGADAWRERRSQNNSRFREDQQRLGARALLPAANIKLCA